MGTVEKKLRIRGREDPSDLPKCRFPLCSARDRIVRGNHTLKFVRFGPAKQWEGGAGAPRF
jgi:hypothetical protein